MPETEKNQRGAGVDAPNCSGFNIRAIYHPGAWVEFEGEFQPRKPVDKGVLRFARGYHERDRGSCPCLEIFDNYCVQESLLVSSGRREGCIMRGIKANDFIVSRQQLHLVIRLISGKGTESHAFCCHGETMPNMYESLFPSSPLLEISYIILYPLLSSRSCHNRRLLCPSASSRAISVRRRRTALYTSACARRSASGTSDISPSWICHHHPSIHILPDTKSRYALCPVTSGPHAASS